MSENKFKIGDKVVCIEDAALYSSEVDAGEHYTVRGVSKYNNLSLEEVSGWWDGSRFELVQEEQEAMQGKQNVQITDEMILIALGKLDAYARGYDPVLFGLPLYSDYKGEMVLIVKESLGILTERDKQIKQLQDIAGIDKEQAEKLIEAGVVKTNQGEE